MKITIHKINNETPINIHTETNFRNANKKEDGYCVCTNCRRINDGRCPKNETKRTNKTTCDYFKINTENI